MESVTFLLILVLIVLGILITAVNDMKKYVEQLVENGISETNSFEVSEEDMNKIVVMIIDELEKRKKKKAKK